MAPGLIDLHAHVYNLGTSLGVDPDHVARVRGATTLIDAAVQLFGGMGYMAESEIERQYRDMRILGIGGGTTEILTSLAAKTLGYQA